MQCVYVLKSLKDGNLYVGCTKYLTDRIEKHNSGKVLSTKNRRPLALIYSENYENVYEAFKIEKFYKSAKGKRALLVKMKYSGIV